MEQVTLIDWRISLGILVGGVLVLLLTWFVYEKIIPKGWIGWLEGFSDNFDDDDKPKKDKSKGRVCYSIEDENCERDYL